MNILFLSHTFDNGGVEKNISQLVLSFKKRASVPINVKVVSLLGKGPLYDAEFCKCLMPLNLNVQKIRKFKFFSYILILLFLPVLIFRLKKEVKNFSPQVVCSNMWLSDILASLLKHNEEFKLVSIQHDIIKINFLLTYFKTIALKRMNNVVAVSCTVKKFLVDYFKVPENKIKLIYNGIDYKKFESCKKENLNAPLVLGTIARLDKIKGHILVLEALKLLSSQGVALPQYIIVGDGPEKNILHTFVSQNNLKNVLFVGNVVDISVWLKQIDIFVLPSKSEGMGIAIIEAMLAKKLIIASDMPTIKELIINKETGLLINPVDSLKLAETILWTLSHRDEINIIKNNSYEWIKSNEKIFESYNSTSKYLDVFGIPYEQI